MNQNESQECCKNCKHIRRLKHNFEQGIGFEESHCCVIFANEKNTYILEVPENGMCEMFDKKEKE